jgi:hypothetical protein
MHSKVDWRQQQLGLCPLEPKDMHDTCDAHRNKQENSEDKTVSHYNRYC